MELLIIRHADAGDSDEWAKTGKPDAERPLSEKGRRQLEQGARGIVRLVPRLDLVATSPYTRARQTTDLVLEHYTGTPQRKVTDALLPESAPGDFARWLRGQGSPEIVAAVGHEPNLSTLATWLIAGLEDSRLRLRKGGACLISFENHITRNEGVLQWLVGPRQL